MLYFVCHKRGAKKTFQSPTGIKPSFWETPGQLYLLAVADPGVLKEGWLTLQSDIRTIRDKIAPVIVLFPFLILSLKDPK